MATRKFYRVNADLNGKALSAQTIASFFACQQCSDHPRMSYSRDCIREHN